MLQTDGRTDDRTNERTDRRSAPTTRPAFAKATQVKRWGMTIINYCSEIFKRKKQKFDRFSLKSSRGTQGVAKNMTVH